MSNSKFSSKSGKSVTKVCDEKSVSSHKNAAEEESGGLFVIKTCFTRTKCFWSVDVPGFANLQTQFDAQRNFAGSSICYVLFRTFYKTGGETYCPRAFYGPKMTIFRLKFAFLTVIWPEMNV